MNLNKRFCSCSYLCHRFSRIIKRSIRIIRVLIKTFRKSIGIFKTNSERVSFSAIRSWWSRNNRSWTWPRNTICNFEIWGRAWDSHLVKLEHRSQLCHSFCIPNSILVSRSWNLQMKIFIKPWRPTRKSSRTSTNIKIMFLKINWRKRSSP